MNLITRTGPPLPSPHYFIVVTECPVVPQVKLRLSMPSLQYKEVTDGKPTSQATTTPVSSVIGLESSSSMDICSFQLCLAAQLVKILLTASPELDSIGKKPASTVCLREVSVLERCLPALERCLY